MKMNGLISMKKGGAVNPMNLKLIRNTDPLIAMRINLLYENGSIQDYSEDGWVLVGKEWYPFETYEERVKNVKDSLKY
jgi:hypothetical protein